MYGMYQRNVSVASIERMAQLPEVKTNSIRRSNESLNFQLAQPDIPPASPGISKAKLDESENPESEINYLETEIDSYTGLNFKNKQSFPTLIRPPTPPKPSLRAFTFGSTNPFVVGSTENAPNNDLYTTVNKLKSKPMVPPKPSLKQVETTCVNDQTNFKRLSTTSLFDNLGESNGKTKIDDANLIQRVSSLPNLAPLQMLHVGDRLQPFNDIRLNSTVGYGIINKFRENGTSPKPTRMVDDSNDVEYCDMIPESPSYINELPNDSENVYEDVRISSPKRVLTSLQQQRPSHKFVSDILNKTPESDYTEMVSPISDVSFSFPGFSIYENLPVHLPSQVGFNANYDGDPSEEVFEPPLQFSSSDNDGDPITPHSNRAPVSLEYKTVQNYANSGTISHRQLSDVSPSPSSSVASTVASSFQGIQVCYFPPQRPTDLYGDFNTSGLPTRPMNIPRRPESASDFSTASSSDISRRSSTRPSRSRIPVPVKSPSIPDNYPVHNQITVPEEPAPPLPPTPSPSPAPIPKNKKKINKQSIKLSPPSPPTGKSARWYEKLGCIQSDTIQPAEPYGLPGERKRSKSLSKEHRKSKFFVPVEPNDAPPDSSTSLSSL